ncbi:hypothetical protein Cgig2_028092 [Carnegiea gigantea]|uniref:Protein kinase domain-containing protein n=1 Tax=Carnegiea gigantea TaxID=171969 RepID=A0A9Q1QJV2_9CARY|nr:hypothetical protein Cgig2_028092 [Carnegiea gigantea]
MNYIRSGSFRRLLSIGRCSSSRFSDESPAIDQEITDNPLKIDSKPTWKCFSFDEIFAATNGFSSENLVGKGGHAEVYRGELSDGQMVAVKKLKKAANEERREREFLTEIGTIGHVFHPNVSSLLGCCIDNGLFLLFPLSPRGSVASLLHDFYGFDFGLVYVDQNAPPMEWKVRYKIAIGTAKGLHYLHKGCQRRIIHRDIKASNILLSEDFEPQAKPILKRGEIEKLIDPRLEGTYDAVEVGKLALAASLCIRASATWRPTMSEFSELGGYFDENFGKVWVSDETISNKACLGAPKGQNFIS